MLPVRVLFPTFLIESEPSVQLGDLKSRRYDLLRRPATCAACGLVFESRGELESHALESAEDPVHLVHKVMES